MVFRADAEWARAYMEKKGRAPPPELSGDPPVAGSCTVPDMKEGDPCRRCGSGLCSYPITLSHGEKVWVCDVCEMRTIKRLDDHYGRDP